MTNITKAAQDDQALAALDRLVETYSRNYHPFANPLASDAQAALRHIRAALQDKAGEVRVVLTDDDLDKIDMDAEAEANQNLEGDQRHWRKAYLRAFARNLFAAQPAPVMSDDVVRYRTIRSGLVYIEPHESGEIYVAGETGVYTKSGYEFDAAIDAIAAAQAVALLDKWEYTRPTKRRPIDRRVRPGSHTPRTQRATRSRGHRPGRFDNRGSRSGPDRSDMSDSSTCNDAVYRYGQAIGMFDMTNDEAEAFCKAKTTETGDLHDWHRFAGHACVKVLKAHRVLHDGKWYWVQYEGLGKTYEAPAMYRSEARAFYSVEFSGIPTNQVLVLKEA